MPEIPSAKVMRRQLRDLVRENQKSILQKLPSGAKLSLALDCWTSPFRQTFMAITGYFLDEDWEYHEILLGFEHLHGSRTGANLSEALFQLLQEHQITDRVLAVTTDNASNNVTLMASVHEAIESLQSSNDVVIIRVPCIAHVIQLSLKDLLGKMKAAPKNDTAEQAWSDDRVDSLRARQQKREIVNTLNKVRHRDFILIHYPNLFLRFEALRFISTRVLSAESHSTTCKPRSQSLFQYRMLLLDGTPRS